MYLKQFNIAWLLAYQHKPGIYVLCYHCLTVNLFLFISNMFTNTVEYVKTHLAEG